MPPRYEPGFVIDLRTAWKCRCPRLVGISRPADPAGDTIAACSVSELRRDDRQECELDDTGRG